MTRARVVPWITCALLALLVPACSCGGETPTPGGDASTDAGPREDASSSDGGETPDDAGPGDAGPATCTTDAECQDDVFCDGAERCAPDDPAADERGCAPPHADRCMPTQTCDETADACLTECEVDADADDDGFDAVACGGEDCDDSLADVRPDATELCNARDDDCDASSDEGFDVAATCDGEGECGEGTIECAPDGTARCSTEPGASADQSATEICDALDQDCDGTVDEEFAIGSSCTALGECGEGVFECAPDGTARCSTEPGASADGSSPELCDDLDQDCDGDPLNGLDVGGACTGLGACGEGVRECALDGSVRCSTAPGGSADASGPEICNGLDESCDGNADEGDPGGGTPCSTGLIGICATGVTECQGASGVVCTPGVTPGSLPESCNGLDDDCDGLTDDAIAQVGQPCTAPGFLGICQFGTYSCPASAPFQLTCDHPLPGTIQETCNGRDDDCNGTIDDPALVNGRPCGTGLPSVCAPGTTLCIGGSQQCVPNIAPGSQPELCDAIDNNCDGQTNEMNPNPACTSQNPSAQFVSSWACSTGNCQILTCQTGHANIDGAPGNGCECVTDAYANSCGSASTVSVPRGGMVNMVGKIESATGSDFLVFNFTVSAVGQSYHPRIELTNSAGGQYAMDVLTSCTSAAGCSTTGTVNNETGLQATVWEQSYSGYTAGPGCCGDNTPRVGSVIVRVYRRFANQPTCDSYTVTATNP